MIIIVLHCKALKINHDWLAFLCAVAETQKESHIKCMPKEIRSYIFKMDKTMNNHLSFLCG